VVNSADRLEDRRAYAVLIVVFEGRSLRVPVKLHEQVAEFYASYWLTLAGLSRAQLQNQRRTAQIRLRYPPGAWDGAEINDPNVEPDQKVQWYI